MRAALPVVVLLLVSSLSSSPMGRTAEPVGEIALSSIWANCAADARPLRELEPDLLINLDTPEKIARYGAPEDQLALHEKAKTSFVYRIQNALMRPEKESKAPKSGLAVAGVVSASSVL
jgi:hypothetical protein